MHSSVTNDRAAEGSKRLPGQALCEQRHSPQVQDCALLEQLSGPLGATGLIASLDGFVAKLSGGKGGKDRSKVRWKVRPKFLECT